MKVIRQVLVKNRMGLHTRPATEIARLLLDYKCAVHFEYKQEKIDAKSILNILILGARKDSQITIIADGVDAEDAIEKLTLAFENEFGESRR